MAKQKETKFKEKVLPELKTIPRSWFYKTQMLSISGIPDILGCVNGRFVALELKISKLEYEPPKGRARLQAHILAKIRGAGGYAEFVSPENWEHVLNEISSF